MINSKKMEEQRRASELEKGEFVFSKAPLFEIH